MSRRTVDYRRSHVYEAEEQALVGTTIAENVLYEDLVADANKVLGSSWWTHTGGKACYITQSRSRTTSYWRGSKRELAFVAVAPRYIAAHELAHALHTFVDRTDDDRGHGAEWRGWYVVMLGAMYGADEALTLHEGFLRHNLDVLTPAILLPPVPLCAFDMPAPEIGGWRGRVAR